MIIYPITRQRVVTAKHTGDIIFDAEGASAISEEAVPLLTGSDYGNGRMVKNDMMWRGAGDKQQGTDAWLEGARLDELHDSHGVRKSTFVKRQKKIYRKLV